MGAPPQQGAVPIADGAVSTQLMKVNADGSTVNVISPTNTGLPVNLPVIVQKAAGVSTGSVATLAQAFGSNNVAGNSIIVVCACGNGTAMTVADSAGNTYQQAVTKASSTTFETSIFYASGILGGANIVTVTNAGTAASLAVEIYEVSGLIAQAAAVVGQTSTGSGTGTTGTTSPIAGASPNTLVFAGLAIGTAVVTTIAAGTGLTFDSGVQQPVTPSGLFQFASFSGFMGNIGGISPSITWAGSEPWAMAAAVFKPVVLGVEGTVRIGGYTPTNITTATTTLIKTGPGVLHAIVINTPVGSGVIEFDDALTHTTPKLGTITFPATLLNSGPNSVIYDAAFLTGLSITTTGTMDITVLWK